VGQFEFVEWGRLAEYRNHTTLMCSGLYHGQVLEEVARTLADFRGVVSKNAVSDPTNKLSEFLVRNSK